MDIERIPKKNNNELDRLQQLEDDVLGGSDEDNQDINANLIEKKDKKKKVINRKPVPKVDAHTLLNPEKGLSKLYLDSLNKQEKLSEKAQLQPVKALGDLMSITKEWAFQLNPRFDFEFFLEKCHRLGKSKDFTPYLSKFRDIHTGDMTFSELITEYDSKYVDIATDNRLENYEEEEKIE